jgi:hypothetical protein
MSSKHSNDSICVCQKAKPPNKQAKKASYFLGLLIAILPKCPFCAFGYSAVLTMCSGKSFHTYIPSSLNWIPIFLSIILIFSLIFNFKRPLSIYAILIALLGASLITYSELFTGSETLYYFGVLMLFISVLFNGRFQYLLKRLNVQLR